MFFDEWPFSVNWHSFCTKRRVIQLIVLQEITVYHSLCHHLSFNWYIKSSFICLFRSDSDNFWKSVIFWNVFHSLFIPTVWCSGTMKFNISCFMLRVVSCRSVIVCCRSRYNQSACFDYLWWILQQLLCHVKNYTVLFVCT